MKMGNFGILRLRRIARCTPRIWWPLLGLLLCAAAGCGKTAEQSGTTPGGPAAGSMAAASAQSAKMTAKTAANTKTGAMATGANAGATTGADTDTIIPKDAKGVKTVTVESSAITEYLQIPGSVTPDPTRVVHVFAAAGGRLLEMAVRPWDRVEQGQTLALLESSDVSRAVSEQAKASTDAQVKKKALDRAADLYAHHAIAEKDLEQAEADWQMAEADEKAALSALHLLGVNPETSGVNRETSGVNPETGANQLRVKAPRSGIVLEIGAASGELSKSLDAPQPLCTIADLSTIWVEGDAFEEDANLLRAGAAAKVTLNAYPGRSWLGRVGVISDVLDPATRTLKVRVVLANPDLALKPNMFATVWLLRATAQGIEVPAAAVIREGAKSYVYVAAAADRFERREVTLGRTENEQVQVLTGLRAGEVVVSDGALLLREAPQS
jgi:membrane fusion protein, heavy metal efflux system